MKKSDKKLESKLVKQLRLVCDELKGLSEDFLWLSHQVNYQQFPQSLVVSLTFSADVELEKINQSVLANDIRCLISKRLATIDIALKKPLQQVIFIH